MSMIKRDKKGRYYRVISMSISGEIKKDWEGKPLYIPHKAEEKEIIYWDANKRKWIKEEIKT